MWWLWLWRHKAEKLWLVVLSKPVIKLSLYWNKVCQKRPLTRLADKYRFSKNRQLRLQRDDRLLVYIREYWIYVESYLLFTFNYLKGASCFFSLMSSKSTCFKELVRLNSRWTGEVRSWCWPLYAYWVWVYQNSRYCQFNFFLYWRGQVSIVFLLQVVAINIML